ncbi:hypothetical protein KJ673_02085 [Patescibacteria group bacterium]|nr:hypothetical protein [Patescibacteria group bacterium]MCG2687952.1 hypothetical protein [Candidatus Parcubacteria bacterium]
MQTFLLGLRYFFIDLIGGILRWPIWWYTRGLVLVAKGGKGWIMGYAKSLALSVWLKNLFVPMYGMYDWQSRIISFLMRVAQIIVRAIGVLFLIIAVFIVMVIYLLLPIATVGTFIYEIVSLYA